MLARGYTGFPEWLPGSKRREKEFINIISQVYESYGYTPIETAAVEKIEDLVGSTGDVGKEVYGLHRLAGDSSAKYGLHFDQTLPFARYTANNYGSLQFPFKRYQIQKVWRGERPQTGRYREFYQADIDVIGDGELPLFYDAEVIEVIYDVFDRLAIGDFKIRINNRKLLEGLYKVNGIDNSSDVFIIVDKINKVGVDEVERLLKEAGLNKEQARFCADTAQKKFSITEGEDFLNSLNASNELLSEAKYELLEVFNNLKHLADDKIIFDLSIARGLDYYTGLVYETEIVGLEKFGSVCSGGRYENLASKFSKKILPGVGVSIGLSRLLFLLFDNDRLTSLSVSPTQVYIILFEESQRQRGNKLAKSLRQEDLCVEVSHKVRKLAKQIQFAEKRGARFILILENDDKVNMKDLKTGEQESFSLDKIKSFF